MKVATLSFQHAYNYGAVLQVEALQNIIESLGVECDIIDYRCPAIDNQYNFKPIKLNRTLLSSIRANIVLLPFIKKKKRNFETWMNNYKKTEVIHRKDFTNLNIEYDKFIVGSDQVWNFKCQGHDTSFFLDFVKDNSKKIAYAASFGTFNIKEEDKKTYRDYISKFASISVRENRGIHLIQKLTGRTPIACMDPVLLAGIDFWKLKMDNSDLPKEKYIFVYQLGHDKLVPNFARKMKAHFGYRIFFITGHIGNMVHYSMNDTNMSSASPEKFLALLANAEFVITNSFHATVLSLIFKRQFFTVEKGEASSSYNSRLFNLLSDYNLEERIVSEFNDYPIITDEKFLNVEQRRQEYSIQSMAFLKKSLEITT